MNTLIITDTADLTVAAKILQEGGLVASPTETVYGLCANALNEAAVKKIYMAKGRPSDNPLIVHIANLNMLAPLVQEIPAKAKLLMQHFWPGPLTMIFKATSLVPRTVTGGLSTVAIRFPSDPTIQRLIHDSGLPLAAPSANLSGKPSPTNGARVIEDLGGKIDAIIVGDNSSYGVESTVVDMTSSIPTILRPGGITAEMLKDVLGEIAIDPALGHVLKEGEQPKAPGMKYIHYSPNAEVIIVSGEINQAVSHINQLVLKAKALGKKVGVLATDETGSSFKADIVISAGSGQNLLSISSRLFEVLREFDDAEVDMVYSLAFPKKDLGEAIMNRLEKSAGYHIIYV